MRCRRTASRQRKVSFYVPARTTCHAHLFQRRQAPDQIPLLQAVNRGADRKDISDDRTSGDPARTSGNLGELPGTLAVEAVDTDCDRLDQDLIRRELLAQDGGVESVIDEVQGRLEAATAC